MATTFVVETGAGIAGANSYLSVADADQYHENVGTAAASWSSKTTAEKQQALRDATEYLDAAYNSRWKGIRTTRTNPLDWPRSGVVDTDGYTVDSDDIPVQLEEATAEGALRSLTEELLPDVTSPGRIETIAEKVGPISRSRKYVSGQGEFKKFTIIERKLRDLTEPAGTRMLERA